MMPIAMMLGFSGPRKWSVASDADDTIERTVDHEVEAWLIRRLSLLSRELDLEPGFFFCGVSQIAIRGDMAFTRACRTLKIPQRILLTQHRDAYFGSGEPEGPPDFTDDEKVEALALLESPHIIEDRMASRAPDRLTRFEETNVELVRQSDLLICLILRNSETRRGGTQDVIAKAKKSGKPVLCVTIEVLAGGVDFQEEWLGDPFLPGEQIKVASHAHCGLFDPEIPDIHAPDGFPCSDRCLQTMMEHSEREARNEIKQLRELAKISDTKSAKLIKGSNGSVSIPRLQDQFY